MKRRQSPTDRRNIAHGFGLYSENKNYRKDYNNRHERGRHRFGNFREEIGDQNSKSDQSCHYKHRSACHPLHFSSHIHLKLLQLGRKNNKCKSVYKSIHHRFRHEADVFSPFENSYQNLDNSR